ncbi:hypothetical protein [Saccharibacter sp. 17.LH.SD]|uniref:hypothetical protein n=1 Tax=Saccharibacter sp. 17.LH.SD TaxID=2689393 RepID=UPI001F321140|nr:hypothetical protein [Saccharibacter sp. 17.LH.SD]
MMLRRFALAALAVSTLAGQAALAQGHAHPCRNEKGQFAKCEKDHKPKPCRNEKGQFAKCDKKDGMKAMKDMKSDMKSDMPLKPDMPDAKMPAENPAAK